MSSVFSLYSVSGGCSQASPGTKRWSCWCCLLTRLEPSWSESRRQAEVRGSLLPFSLSFWYSTSSIIRTFIKSRGLTAVSVYRLLLPFCPEEKQRFVPGLCKALPHLYPPKRLGLHISKTYLPLPTWPCGTLFRFVTEAVMQFSHLSVPNPNWLILQCLLLLQSLQMDWSVDWQCLASSMV